MELRLRHSGARLVVVDRDRAAALAGMEIAVAVVVAEDVATELRGLGAIQPTYDTTVADPAFIVYSSGTTKAPRATAYAHGDTRVGQRRAAGELDAGLDDVVWRTSDPGSAASIWNGLLVPWSVGAQVVIHDGHFDIHERFALIQRLGVTVLCQAQTEYRVMAEHTLPGAADLGGLRRAVAVEGPLDPEVAEAFQAVFELTVEEESDEEIRSVPDLEQAGSLGGRAVAAADPVETPNGRLHTATTPDGRGRRSISHPGRRNRASSRSSATTSSRASHLPPRPRIAPCLSLPRTTGRRQKEARRAEADAHRAANEKARVDERERKQQEKAAAEQARELERQAEADRRAAAASAAAEVRERRRQDEAAAKEARRAEADARRAAGEQATADERERKQREKAAAENRPAAISAKLKRNDGRPQRAPQPTHVSASDGTRPRQRKRAAPKPTRAGPPRGKQRQTSENESNRRKPPPNRPAAISARLKRNDGPPQHEPTRMHASASNRPKPPQRRLGAPRTRQPEQRSGERKQRDEAAAERARREQAEASAAERACRSGPRCCGGVGAGSAAAPRRAVGCDQPEGPRRRR